jgi:hypothetical protein
MDIMDCSILRVTSSDKNQTKEVAKSLFSKRYLLWTLDSDVPKYWFVQSIGLPAQGNLGSRSGTKVVLG